MSVMGWLLLKSRDKGGSYEPHDTSAESVVQPMMLPKRYPRLKTVLPGPLAKKAIEADDRLISPSYTRSYPLVVKSGSGTRITDVDGNTLLDFTAGIAVTSTGHCHPHVVQAIQEQAAKLIHMSGTDFYYESMTTLAERLSAVALRCRGRTRFYYGNSGA